MSNFIYRCTLLVATICCLAGATSTNAQTNYYWNGGSIATTPAAGGSGTWSTTNAWRTVSNTGSQATWANNNNAIFAGTAGTVALSADVVAAAVTVSTTNYIFATNSTTTRSLTSPVTLDANVNLGFSTTNSTAANSTFNMGGSVSGGTDATIQIFGINGFASRVNLGSANNQTLSISLPTNITGGSSTSFSGFGMSGSFTGITATISGNITNNSSATTFLGANAGNILNINGVVSGSANLQFSSGPSGGAGTINLNTATTHTGSTIFNANAAAIIKMGLVNVFPSATNVVMGNTANSSGIWDLNGYNQTIGSITSGITTASAIITNNASTYATLTISGSTIPTSAFVSPIKDGTTNKTSLVRGGTGTTELTGACTYTGLTTINGGTLRLNKTGGNTIPTSNNMTVNGGTLRISTDQTLQNLLVANGATVTVDAGINLTITGTLTNNGTINADAGKLIIASSTTGTANVFGTGIYSNAVTMQRYIPASGRRFRFISHPFSTARPLSIISGIDYTGNGGTANGFSTTTITGSPSVFSFNTANANGAATDAGWKEFSRGDSAGWAVGQGIRILVRGTAGQGLDGAAYTPNATTINMLGVLNSGTVNVPITTGGSGTTANFNLVGNPLPSNVNIEGIINANINISNKTIYVRNPSTSAYITKDLSLAGNAGYQLPSASAFFIVANTSTNIAFTEADKVTTNSGDIVFRYSPTKGKPYIELSAFIGNKLYDNLYVKYDADYKPFFEASSDAIKPSNDNFNFYAISQDDKPLSLNALAFENNSTVPLGVNISSGKQTIQLKVTDFRLDDNLYQVTLLDRLLNTKTQLALNTTYTFEANKTDSATIGNNRFALLLNTKPAKPSIIDAPAINAFSAKLVAASNNQFQLQITNPTQTAITVTVINSLGQILARKNIGNATGNISIANGSMPIGIYVLQVITGTQTITLKTVKP